MEKQMLKLEIEVSQELAEKMAKLTAMDGEANQSVLAQIFDYKNKPITCLIQKILFGIS